MDEKPNHTANVHELQKHNIINIQIKSSCLGSTGIKDHSNHGSLINVVKLLQE